MKFFRAYINKDSSRTLGLKHIGPSGCGFEFNVLLESFKKAPYCRCCENNRPGPNGVFKYSKIHYVDIAKRRAKDLVGNDYELLDYNGKNERFHLLHRYCNTITEIKGNSFWLGARCRLCSYYIPYQELCDIVYECTGKPCNILSYNKNRLAIVIGDTAYHLTAKLLLQELSRPTPSQIIPNIVKKYIPAPSLKSRLYLEIKECCLTHRVWDRRKSTLVNTDKTSCGRILARLTAEKYIYSCWQDYYSIYSDIIVEDIIQEKYLQTESGEINGIYSGSSLAYELGIIECCPSRYCVYTNQCTSTRTIKIMGKHIVLLYCPTPVDHNNKAFIECAELVRWTYSNRHYLDDVCNYFKTNAIDMACVQPYISKFGPYIRNFFSKKFLKM